VATVNVSLALASIQEGATTQATAELRDARNNVLTGRTITWSSDNAPVATVNATTGLVTAVSVGTASITATSEGITGSATVTVTAPPPAPVASIVLSTPDSSLIQFDTVQVTAELRDAANNVLTGRTITWSSSAPAIATVSSSGEVAAVGIGTATITATSEGVNQTLDLTIAPAPVATVNVSLALASIQEGATTQATAELRDARNNVLTGRTITWASDNASIATVNETTGLVTAVSVGTASITATSEGITGSATVTVTAPPPAPVASIVLSTPDSSLIQFDTVQVTAELRDAANNVLTGRTITWSSSAPAIATVSSSGEVAAVGIGTATITATSEGVSQTLDLTIAPAPVATVNVSLALASLQEGATTQATAELRDARNNVLTGRTITWASDNASIATVNATTGLVTAVSVGTASITATSEGVNGSATVTVTAAPPAPVASIVLSTPDSSLIQFDTVQVTAELRDAANNVLTGRTITWSTSAPAIATVSSSGEVAAVGIGNATITATSEGVNQTLDLTIAPAPVASVTVALASDTIDVTTTTTASATLRDARNNVLTGRTIAWSSSNAAIATVDVDGLVTGVTAGEATITATSEGISGGAIVTVVPPPPLVVESITLSVPDSSLVQYDTVQVTAEIRDPAGTLITGREIVWTSLDTLVAIVNDSGLVIAVAPGSVKITATSDGVEGVLELTVAAPAVASITVTLAASTVLVGDDTQATATLRDTRGNVLAARTIVWRVGNEMVATVSASGLVTGVRMGATEVIATSAGVSGESTVRVRNP
jgi:trimeric autotransporter adhesin